MLRNTLNYNPEIQGSSEKLSVSDAIKLVNSLSGEIGNTELTTRVTLVRTKLLQLQENGIEYVTGAIQTMLSGLRNKPAISQVAITGLFMNPSANDERWSQAA